MSPEKIAEFIKMAFDFVSAHEVAIESALGTGILILMRIFPTKNPAGPFAMLAGLAKRVAALAEGISVAIHGLAELLMKVEAILDAVVPQNLKPAAPAVEAPAVPAETISQPPAA